MCAYPLAFIHSKPDQKLKFEKKKNFSQHCEVFSELLLSFESLLKRLENSILRDPFP